MAPSEPVLLVAHDFGYHCRLNGSEQSANPYRYRTWLNPEKYWAWDLGWRLAEFCQTATGASRIYLGAHA
jgi:hypothetical protein